MKTVSKTFEFDIYELEPSIDDAIKYLQNKKAEFEKQGYEGISLNISVGGYDSCNESFFVCTRPETIEEKQERLRTEKIMEAKEQAKKAAELERMKAILEKEGYKVS